MTNQLEAAKAGWWGLRGESLPHVFFSHVTPLGPISSPFSAATFLILPTGSCTIHSLTSILSLQTLELVTLVPRQKFSI